MAYSDVKVLVLTATPERHKSHPMGFSGLREATMAPIVASITTSALPSHQLGTGVPGSRKLRTTRSRLSAVNTSVIAHNVQASPLADRTFIFSRFGPATTAR